MNVHPHCDRINSAATMRTLMTIRTKKRSVQYQIRQYMSIGLIQSANQLRVKV